MSFLTFASYVIILYIIYYVSTISYDLLASNPAKSVDNNTIVQYDFGNVPAPKVATLDNYNEDSQGGKGQRIEADEIFSEQEIKEENETASSVDLSLERANAKNFKEQKLYNPYKQ